MSKHLKQEFLLDPDVILLNHGSFGACPRPVFETYQRRQADLERRAGSALRPAAATVLDYLHRFIEPRPALARGHPITLVAGNVPVAAAPLLSPDRRTDERFVQAFMLAVA
jgi:hypothetical protein